MSITFDIENFAFRVVQDAMNQASASFWHRRADQFAACLPRPGDFPGRSITEVEREKRRQWVETTVRNCRHRATICELTEAEEQMILDALALTWAADRQVAA